MNPTPSDDPIFCTCPKCLRDVRWFLDVDDITCPRCGHRFPVDPDSATAIEPYGPPEGEDEGAFWEAFHREMRPGLERDLRGKALNRADEQAAVSFAIGTLWELHHQGRFGWMNKESTHKWLRTTALRAIYFPPERPLEVTERSNVAFLGWQTDPARAIEAVDALKTRLGATNFELAQRWVLHETIEQIGEALALPPDVIEVRLTILHDACSRLLADLAELRGKTLRSAPLARDVAVPAIAAWLVEEGRLPTTGTAGGWPVEALAVLLAGRWLEPPLTFTELGRAFGKGDKATERRFERLVADPHLRGWIAEVRGTCIDDPVLRLWHRGYVARRIARYLNEETPLWSFNGYLQPARGDDASAGHCAPAQVMWHLTRLHRAHPDRARATAAREGVVFAGPTDKDETTELLAQVLLAHGVVQGEIIGPAWTPYAAAEALILWHTPGRDGELRSLFEVATISARTESEVRTLFERVHASDHAGWLRQISIRQGEAEAP